MRPFDYEDLDELDFDTFAANRRPHRGKQHHKAAGHKRHKAFHNDPWADDDWDEFDNIDDYDSFDFDDDSGLGTSY